MAKHEIPDDEGGVLDELQELFDKELDGTLTDDERKRLQELLGEPANRSRYSAWTRAARAGATLYGARPRAGFADRVMAGIENHPQPAAARTVSFARRLLDWWIRPRTLSWNPIGATAAAATLVVAVALSNAGRPAVTPDSEASLAHVRFVYYGQAAQVSVAGSFNAWSPDAASMAQVRPGVWAIDLSLTRGRHEYAFVLDGKRWVADPAAPVHVDDGFGQTNARLEI